MNIDETRYVLKEHAKKISFDSLNHKYYSGNKELISVTTLISKFTPKFDEDGSIIKQCAIGQGVTVEELQAKWDKAKTDGTTRGTILHNYAERKLLKLPTENVAESLQDRVKHIDNYIENYVYKKSIVVSTEDMLFSEKYNVAGTGDFITYEDGQYVLNDWKFNKKLNSIGTEDMLFLGLKNNDINKYSLQLSTYNTFLRELGINISKQRIIHITELGFNIIELPYLEGKVYNMLNKHKVDIGYLDLYF